MQNETTCQATKGNKKRHKLGDKLGKKGDKALGRRTRLPTKENKKKDRLGDKRGEGRQVGDKADKALGRGTHHPTKGNKKGEKLGDKLGDRIWETSCRSRETRPRDGRHTSNKGKKKEDKLGDKGGKASGRRTHHPTKRGKKGDKLRQAKSQERQGLGKADTSSNKGPKKNKLGDKRGGQDGRQAGRQGRQGRQGLGKADTPSNKGKKTSWEISWETR